MILQWNYSEGYIKYLSSEEPKQTDELYIMKILKIQSDILKIFIDASATKDEISHTIAWVTADVWRHEKNILCNLTGANNYHDINFRKINEIALKIDDKNFTN
jgi:hypothetical protein